MIFWFEIKKYVYSGLSLIIILSITYIIFSSNNIDDGVYISKQGSIFIKENTLKSDFDSYNVFPEDIKISCVDGDICNLIKTNVNSLKKSLIFQLNGKLNSNKGDLKFSKLFDDIEKLVGEVIINTNFSPTINKVIEKYVDNSDKKLYSQNYYMCIENIKSDMLEGSFEYDKNLLKRVGDECDSYKKNIPIDESTRTLIQKDIEEDIIIIISRVKIDYKGTKLVDGKYIETKNKTFYKNINLTYSGKVNSKNIINEQ